MKIRLHICCLLAVMFLVSCARERHIDIKLKDAYLETTPAGFWLSRFDLSYTSGAQCIKLQIVEELKKHGDLVDEYTNEDGANRVKTSVYNYKGNRVLEQYYAGGIWKGPKIIPYQEYYNAGWNVWLTIEFEEGIPYSQLLPDHYAQINPNRKYEHTATIKSEKDNGRRLFLFGYGNLCKRISLF